MVEDLKIARLHILVLLVKIRQQVLPEKTGSAKALRKQGLLSMTIGTDANQNLQ